jgi:hypothetical protein
MSAFCDCPLVCEDATKTLCIICENKIPQPLTDEAADRIHLLQNTVTKENVYSFDIAPEDWTDEDHTALIEEAGSWELTTVNPQEEVLDNMHEYVYRVVYDRFWEEYGDLIKGIDGYMEVSQAYMKYRDIGKTKFHKYLGEELQFKMFCDRFYSKLRELYNIDSVGMREAFEKMREKKQTFYQFELELQQRGKR